MSDANKMLLQRFFQVLYNQGDLDRLNEIVAANYVNQATQRLVKRPVERAKKAFVSHLRSAFTDLHIAIEDQVAADDKVVTRFTISGIQQGAFAGIPATGKRASVTAIGIHRIHNGQIQESWLNWDALGLMQQLGVLSPVAIAS
ncbi:MAG: ester cyclase [Caldilineaceae bacterium]